MAQYAASSYSTAQTEIARDFDTTLELAITGLSVFLAAYAIVPMFLAPVAEVVGRVPLYLIGYFGFLCFTIPTAVTMDISVMIIFRFIAGSCSSVGNTMIAGSITDLFDSESLAAPMTFYIILGLLLSTPVGPLVNGFVVSDKHLGYHWVFWFQVVFGTAVLLVLYFGLEETRPSILYHKKLSEHAKKLSMDLSDEEDEKPTFRSMLSTIGLPWQMMFCDLTVAIFSLWLAFAWGVVYGMLQSIALVFQGQDLFTQSQVGLVFISQIVSLVLGALAAVMQEIWFRKKCREQKKIVPEARLHIACFGSVCMVAGLFYYAWTSGHDIRPIVPIVATGVVFFGIFTIYYAVFHYICDNYSDSASSALSATGFWRNALAAAFPLFTGRLYKSIGDQWAGSVFAFASIPIGLVPFALILFGPKMRAQSKFIET